MTYLLALFALLMLLDGWTTYHVLKAGGRELNKPLAWLMIVNKQRNT